MTSTVLLEYIWIDGSNNLRSKNRVITVNRRSTQYLVNKNLIELLGIQSWNFDGSSTGQADVECSEVVLKPVKTFIDPFLTSGEQAAYFVLCETYSIDGTPHKSNTRHNADKIFNQFANERPWYGIEQEFFLMDRKTSLPVGFFNTNSYNETVQCPPQGQYYCGVGSENAFEREYVLEVYKAALKAGLTISGMNAEVAPGQWEIQVGPCEGIDAADQLWILRYIMHRLTEGRPFYVELHAKPIGNYPVQIVEGSWNGSGAHCNFSTEKMRLDGGYEHIINGISKLSSKHAEHVELYGKDNNLRMTGKHETSDITKFSYSVAGRNVSIRIPYQVEQNKKGYLEDRRPSSSCDPYLVTSKILDTVCN